MLVEYKDADGYTCYVNVLKIERLLPIGHERRHNQIILDNGVRIETTSDLENLATLIGEKLASIPMHVAAP